MSLTSCVSVPVRICRNAPWALSNGIFPAFKNGEPLAPGHFPKPGNCQGGGNRTFLDGGPDGEGGPMLYATTDGQLNYGMGDWVLWDEAMNFLELPNLVDSEYTPTWVYDSLFSTRNLRTIYRFSNTCSSFQLCSFLLMNRAATTWTSDPLLNPWQKPPRPRISGMSSTAWPNSAASPVHSSRASLVYTCRRLIDLSLLYCIYMPAIDRSLSLSACRRGTKLRGAACVRAIAGPRILG